MVSEEDDSVEEQLYFQKQWHLDRRVPVAMLLAIMMQSAIAIWWASSTNTRVDQLERQLASQATIATPQAERIIRLETKVDSVFQSLTEIKQLISPPRQINR